jgi:hypothetical protein
MDLERFSFSVMRVVDGVADSEPHRDSARIRARSRPVIRLVLHSHVGQDVTVTLSSGLTSLSWLPALIPVLATALVKVITAVGDNRQEHRLERRIARHAELISKLPDEVDKAGLAAMLNREIAALATHTDVLLYRRVDSSNVAAMVVVMIITTVLVWFLWWIEPSQRWLDLVLNGVAVVVGLLGFALATIGGFGSFYKDIRSDLPKDSALESADKTPAPAAEHNGSRQPGEVTTRLP